MKKNFLKAMLLIFFSAGFALAGNAQVFVKVRPVAVVKVRPVAPSARHIWVADEYVYRNNRYEVVPGYWAVPPSGRAVWVQGHWKHKRRGWFWIPGHWR
ncbi:MAG: hypothetical protein JSU03_02455 [Bacteroidetes bacterium]|nr:hypothetical protein [Bacteroidota bacterium]MBS1756119.1 hypothetical protein [Bacteroidota bacterium]